METMYFLKHGGLKSFSEQQFVDCDSGNSGCNGGWPTRAFSYAE
jgi:hypothetical protein